MSIKFIPALKIDDICNTTGHKTYLDDPTSLNDTLERFGVNARNIVSFKLYKKGLITAVIIKSKFNKHYRYMLLLDNDNSSCELRTYVYKSNTERALANIFGIHHIQLQWYII